MNNVRFHTTHTEIYSECEHVHKQNIDQTDTNLALTPCIPYNMQLWIFVFFEVIWIICNLTAFTGDVLFCVEYYTAVIYISNVSSRLVHIL